MKDYHKSQFFKDTVDTLNQRFGALSELLKIKINTVNTIFDRR